MVKRVEAVIPPFLVDEVVDQLEAIGIRGITVIDGKGFGRNRGRHMALYRGAEYVVRFGPCLIIIIYSTDEMVQLIIDTFNEIINGCSHKGRGIITVVDVERAVSIMTGFEGDDAI